MTKLQPSRETKQNRDYINYSRIMPVGLHYNALNTLTKLRSILLQCAENIRMSKATVKNAWLQSVFQIT